MKVAAIIITFNPDIALLVRNVRAVIDQVESVLVVDNHSDNFDEIKQNLPVNVQIYPESKNVGIAKATNDGIKIFEAKQFNWILTLDQDSVVAPNYVRELMKTDETIEVAMFAPIVDWQYELIENNQLNLLNAKLIKDVLIYDDVYDAALQVIASGAVIDVDAWRRVGGMDEFLFIDRVDFDFNMKLLLNGYKIQQKNILLQHKLGYPIRKKILFKNRTVLNHSAFRKYFIFRNAVIMCFRYGNKKREALKLFKRLLSILLMEDHKIPKLNKSFTGIIDGFKYQISKTKK